jgi:hypothetical protein
MSVFLNSRPKFLVFKHILVPETFRVSPPHATRACMDQLTFGPGKRFFVMAITARA